MKVESVSQPTELNRYLYSKYLKLDKVTELKLENKKLTVERYFTMITRPILIICMIYKIK